MFGLDERLKELRLSWNDAIDLALSRRLEIQDVKSVCLALGPYRNLTTLTGSVLFLHPNCQVLNHAGRRIFDNRKVDFLLDGQGKTLDRFVQFAIKISGKGQRGGVGGSITHSHAFDSQYEMNKRYAETGQRLTKGKVSCLFWKESLHTSNAIRERGVDLGAIFGRDDRLRFLLPIRHPLDCAVSNLNTGLVRIFRGLDESASIYEAVDAILDEIFWFAELKNRFPGRFHYFFEHEISREMLIGIAAFLELEPDEAWVGSALSAMKINRGYEHDGELVDYYRTYVMGKRSEFPELCSKLLHFVDS